MKAIAKMAKTNNLLFYGIEATEFAVTCQEGLLCLSRGIRMIEVICNDRLGKKVRVKCNEDDTVGDLKRLIAAQIGTRPEKIRIQKWYTVFKDHITLEDYEVHDGMGLELYYN